MWPEISHFIYSELLPFYDKNEARLLSKYIISDLFENDILKYNSDFLNDSLERLKKKEPLQYITGKAYFFDEVFRVDNSVLIPRPETEELVRLAIEIIRKNEHRSILDIGTGSGCIAIILKKKLPHLKVYASDVSKKALKIAGTNAKIIDVEVEFLENDILINQNWKELPKVDLIVSNPPYIGIDESKTLADNVLNYEPHLALFSEGDALMFYKKITEFGFLKNSSLLFEINEKFGKETRLSIDMFGYKNISVIKDMQGKDRFCHAYV